MTDTLTPIEGTGWGFTPAAARANAHDQVRELIESEPNTEFFTWGVVELRQVDLGENMTTLRLVQDFTYQPV